MKNTGTFAHDLRQSDLRQSQETPKNGRGKRNLIDVVSFVTASEKARSIQELHEMTGLPKGSIYAKLATLRKAGVTVKASDQFESTRMTKRTWTPEGLNAILASLRK